MNNKNISTNGFIKGQKIDGSWYVRPSDWAGIYERVNDQLLLKSGDVLFSSSNECDCDKYISNHTLEKALEEFINKKDSLTLPIRELNV